MSSTELVYMTIEWETDGTNQKISGRVPMNTEMLNAVVRQMSENGRYSISTERHGGR